MKISSINFWTKFAFTLLFIGITILVISIAIFVFNFFSWTTTFDSKVASELGGYISGFVGVFWTGAGAILVYATFQEQKKLLVKQQFEASFFKLLDTYNNLLNSMQEKQGMDGVRVGKEYILYVWETIKDGDKKDELWIELSESKGYSIVEIKELLEKRDKFQTVTVLQFDLKDYLKDQDKEVVKNLKDKIKSDDFYFAQFEYFFNKNKSTLEPYCRFISNILKYAEEENSDEKAAYKYLKILWSQMTEEEIVILFYYAKNKGLKGDPKFLTRLKKYNFLGDLSKEAFLRYDHKEKFC